MYRVPFSQMANLQARVFRPAAGDWPFAIVPLVKISLDFFAEIL